jgi:cysteine synthase A
MCTSLHTLPPGARSTDGRARSGILDAVGDTPLVRLDRLVPGAHFRVWAKLEGMNPGGSIKDRPAVSILQEGIRMGRIGPSTVVVEQSAGNMGIGLAQACRYLGLRFVCVIDPKTTEQNVQVLRCYGAEIDCVTAPDPATGEYLPAKLARVKQIVAELDDVFWVDQYANARNPGAHYAATMAEVAAALDGDVDYMFVGTSTCGTLTGCGRYIREHGLATRLVAVDAKGSWIFGSDPRKRLIPGLGAAAHPPFLDLSLIEGVVHVDDQDCVVGCRRLMGREAIFAGGSSGGVVTALERWADRIPEGATCVVLLPDRGERYLDTVFSDTWVREHMGNIEHMWRS